MPDDQTTGKVQHRQIGVGALLPEDQQTPIAIEPARRTLHDPALRSRPLTLGLVLIPTPTNPRHHPDLPDMFIHTAPDTAPIQAQPRARCRLVDDDLRQRLFQQHAGVPVGAGDRQGQRQTVTVK